MIYSKELFSDQFTPVSMYGKVKHLFKDEVTFLFESVVNSSSGNFSYIIVGARERIWHKNDKSFYQNDSNEVEEISSNPFDFMRKLYKKIDKDIYRDESSRLNVGFVDGFIGFESKSACGFHA